MNKIDLKNIDAVIFDLGGVILNLDYDLTVNAFKELGGSRFDELYTQANQDKIFDAYEVGGISSLEFIKYLKQFLPNSISDQDVIDAWNVMLLDLPNERIDFLNELRTQIPIYLFSNTNDLHYQSFKKGIHENFGNENLLEDIFEKTYFSHLCNERKPNHSAFELVLNDHSLSTKRTLFIDDSIQHIEGANSLGIKTYHLVAEQIQEIIDIHSIG
jgi:FMN phosphatase YigB (HAD superfamily)